MVSATTFASRVKILVDESGWLSSGLQIAQMEIEVQTSDSRDKPTLTEKLRNFKATLTRNKAELVSPPSVPQAPSSRITDERADSICLRRNH